MALQYVLPPELTKRLAGLRRRIRFLALLRGAGLALIGVCVLLVSLLILDFCFDFGEGTRVGLLWTFGIGTLALLGWFLVRPLLRNISDVEVASVAELQYPKFGERITSLVELSDPELADPRRSSLLMREMLEEETVRQLQGVDIENAAPSRQAMRRVGAGLTTAFVIFLAFLIFPTFSTGLLGRLFSPWGNHASVGPLQFEVENGNRVVARGTDVPIAAKVSWRSDSDDPIPEPVTLHWTAADGETDFRQLSFNPDSVAFDATVPNAHDNFEFHIEADGSRSERFRIEVVDAPKIETARLQISPPGYIGLPASDFDGVTGPITVFEHSRLKFEVTFNKRVEGAMIEWMAPMVIPPHELKAASHTDEAAGSDPPDGDEDAGRPERRVGSYVNELLALSDSIETELTLASDGKSGTVEIPATIQGTFAFRLKDRHDLRNDDEPHRQILITRDQPPALEVSGGTHDEARPDDVYSLNVSASDDLAVGALELHITSKNGLDRILKTPADKLGLTTAEHQFRADFKDWKVKDGDVLELQVRVADERPIPEPNVVWSEIRSVVIRENASAQGTNDLLARQSELREELRAIRREVGASRDKGDLLTRRAQSDLDSEKEFHEAAELPKLADRESRLTERLRKLGGKFEEHALFTNLVEELKTEAEQPLGKAAGELRAEADQDLTRQLAALKKNSGEADAVEERLIQLEESFEELAALEKDLIELGRLANRATELADDAVRLREFQREIDTGEVPGAETQQQLAEARQALADQQVELLREQNELMAALQSLLEARPELIDAARKHELGRLEDLTAAAKEIADPQAKLAEALREDAAATAQAVADIAAAQEEVVARFEELAAAANGQLADPRRVATPIDPELARQIVDELKKGNLKAADQLQQKASDDLARVIENAKTGPLPRDASEAAAELARRQDDLARRLEQAASQKPEEIESEARDRELRNLAAEQAALQRAAARLDVPHDVRDEQQAALNDAGETLRDLLQAARQNNDAARALADAKTLEANPAGDAEVARENAAALAQEAAAQGQAARNSLNEAAREGKAAAESLRELARSTPSDEERRADAARQLGEIREIQQEDVSRKLSPDGRPGEPLAQPDSRVLAGEERFVAQELAQLDAVGAGKEQQAAVEAAAAAVNDLAANRQADIPASQRQLQQAMAALENRLKGKATPQEQVEQLRRDQAALQQEAAAALKAEDKEALEDLAIREKELASRAAAIEAPAAGNQQNAAQRAIEQAAEALASSQNGNASQSPGQTAQSLQRAGESLSQLAQAMQPANRGSQAAGNVKQLATQQREAAEQNSRLAEDEQLESLQPNRDATNELSEAGDQLERLRVGDVAQAEKLEAIEELRKAFEKQDELNRQLGAPDPAKPNQPAPPRPDAEQIRRTLSELAQTQAAAADALQRLEKKLDPEPTEPGTTGENPVGEAPASRDGQPGEAADPDADLARQIVRESGQQPREAAEVADVARDLARQQAQVREATEQLDDEFVPNTPEDSRQRRQQQQLEEQQTNLLNELNDLPADIGALPRAEAREQMERAAAALEQGNLDQAAQAQQQAGEALGQLARQAQAQAAAEQAAQQAGSELARNSPPQSGAEPGQPAVQPTEGETTPSGPGQPQPGQPGQPGEQPPAANEQLAEQARQLADAQSQLQERLAEFRAEQNAGPSGQSGAETAPPEGTPPAGSQPEGAQPGSESGSRPAGSEPGQQPGEASQPGSQPGFEPQSGQPGSQPQSGQPQSGQPSARELLERQENLTAEAAQLAIEAARQNGVDSPAARAAAQSAANTSDAGEQAQSGQFDQAARQAAQAASDSQQAAQALRENSPQLAQRAEQLAGQQQDLSTGFDQIADSTQQRQAMQAQRQQQLQARAEQLARELEEVANLLGSDVLGLNEQGQQARQAGRTAADSQQAMRQSGQSRQQGNQGEAASAAQRAAESLQQASQTGQPSAGEAQPGGESGQPQSGQPGSEAGSPQPGSPQPGSPQSGSPQSGSPQSGAPQSGNAQPGQTGAPSSGERSPIPGDLASQVAQAAQQLQEAQRALAEAQRAAQQGQPGPASAGQPGQGSQSGEPASGQSGQPGQPGSEGQPGQSGTQPRGSQPGESQPGSQPGEGQPGEGTSGTEGQPGSGEPGEGQPGSGQPGEGQPGSAQPGQSGQGQPSSGQSGQPGQGQGSLAQTAESLRQAAEMLSQAAQQLAPNGQDGGASEPGQQSGPPGSQAAGMGNGQGGNAPPDLAGLDENLRRQALQNWGKLPGKLQTEILQSAGRKKNGDYAKLIKLYFEELAKSGADRK